MRSVVEPTTTVVAVLTMQLYLGDEDNTIHSKKECKHVTVHVVRTLVNALYAWDAGVYECSDHNTVRGGLINWLVRARSTTGGWHHAAHVSETLV